MLFGTIKITLGSSVFPKGRLKCKSNSMICSSVERSCAAWNKIFPAENIRKRLWEQFLYCTNIRGKVKAAFSIFVDEFSWTLEKLESVGRWPATQGTWSLGSREHRAPCHLPEAALKAMLDARINSELIMKVLRKEDQAWAAARDPHQPRSSREELAELFGATWLCHRCLRGAAKGALC